MRHTRARDPHRDHSTVSFDRPLFPKSHAPRVRLVRVRVAASGRASFQIRAVSPVAAARDAGRVVAAPPTRSGRVGPARDGGRRGTQRVARRHRARATPRVASRERRRGIGDAGAGGATRRDIADFGLVDDAEDARGGETRAGEANPRVRGFDERRGEWSVVRRRAVGGRGG